MRRVALVVFLMAASAVPATASAQPLQPSKVGPVTCVRSQVTPNPVYGQKTTTGCTITNGPRTIFCGHVQDVGYREAHDFLGCEVDTPVHHVRCGVTSDGYSYYYVDQSDRVGCTGSVGGRSVDAGCGERQFEPPYTTPEYGTFAGCAVGAVDLRCRVDAPGVCHIAIGPLLDCYVDAADPAGSLGACTESAGARLRE
jgi:hypothetical protein